jgi:hypothetical protein
MEEESNESVSHNQGDTPGQSHVEDNPGQVQLSDTPAQVQGTTKTKNRKGGTRNLGHEFENCFILDMLIRYYL